MKSSKSIRRHFKRTMALSLLAVNPFLVATVCAQVHVDNPFVGATGYVNPDYAKKVDASIAKVNGAPLKAKMGVVKTLPTAVWLDRIDAIAGGSKNAGRLGLRAHLDAALAQKKQIRPSRPAL